jgi:hypothetical protein
MLDFGHALDRSTCQALAGCVSPAIVVNCGSRGNPPDDGPITWNRLAEPAEQWLGRSAGYEKFKRTFKRQLSVSQVISGPAGL